MTGVRYAAAAESNYINAGDRPSPDTRRVTVKQTVGNMTMPFGCPRHPRIV